MIKALSRRPDLICLLILMALTLPRFYKIDGGLVLGEPDESIHQEVAENFKASIYPRYGKTPWFFQMPLYPFLGFLLSPLFPQRYVSLRVISVFSSILLVLGTYLFFSRRLSRRAGFLSASLLAVSPFSIYISRLALLDSTAVSFGLLGVYAFETAWGRSSKVWSFFAGFLLTIAVMTKYTSLVYFIVPFPFLFYSLLKENLPVRDRNVVKINLISLIPIISVLLLTVPVLFLMRRYDPFYFKLQTLTSLGFVRDFWRIKGGELNFLVHLRSIPWWLTWPVLVFFLPGIFFLVRNFKRLPAFFLSLLVTGLVVLPFRPFYPRYFYTLVPPITVLAGLFLSSVVLKLSRLLGLAFCLLVFLAILPTSYEAFRSTDHTLIEKTGNEVSLYRKKLGNNPWLFTNYWPNIIGQAAGTNRTTWLTTSVWDAKGYAPEIESSPMLVLEKEGGFVLLEDLYARSRIFIHPPQRLEAWREIERNYKPAFVVYSDSPNFPHFRESRNKIIIYQLGVRQ